MRGKLSQDYRVSLVCFTAYIRKDDILWSTNKGELLEICPYFEEEIIDAFMILDMLV